MTTPSGPLAWGQAGNYNAINDRLVIRSLAQAVFGPVNGTNDILTLPPTLAAGSGLVINIGPWNAIVDCGDGTSATIGSTAASTISETAGGASQRTDYIWADINPDGATWTLAVITQAAASGRTGVALGTVVVPASAATSAAMTLTPGAAGTSGQVLTSFKIADTTRSSQTLTADPDLSVTLPAAGNYIVSAGVVYRGGTGAAAGHMGWGWTAPVGFGGMYGFDCPNGSLLWGGEQATTWADTGNWAGTDGVSNYHMLWVSGGLIVTAGGTFAFRWCKHVAADGSTDTRVMAGSFMTATKV